MVYVIQLASRIRTERPDPARKLYSKNKFEKLIYLVRFIIRIYHHARSSECEIRLGLPHFA